VDENLAESFGLEKAGGVLITEVQDDTPAAKAGVKSQDIIVKLDDIVIKDTQDLRNRVAETVPGTTVVLQVIRDGKPEDLKVTIGEQPDDFGSVAQGGPAANPLTPYGLTVQELTPDLAEQLGYTDRKGVVISEVAPGSAAADIGITPGLLIEEVQKVRVESLEDLKRVMAEAGETDRVLLRIRSGNGSRYVVLKKQ
jgi:serine protease Do